MIFVCSRTLFIALDIKDIPLTSFVLLFFISVCLSPPSHCHLRLAVGGQSLVLWVHVWRVAVSQRLWEELGQRLDAELPLVGVGLAPAVLLVQWLVLLLLDGVMLLPPNDHVRGRRVLDVALARVPHFEGRAGSEWMSVGLGDLRLGDLGGVDGDSQGSVDVRRWEEWFVLGVEVDWLESGRRLAVGIIYHRIALVVVSCTSFWIMREIGDSKTDKYVKFNIFDENQ